MTAHTPAQREFIALRLARFEAAPDIIVEFERTFTDTRCTVDDIVRCDPGRGGMLSPETLKAFLRERERILVDPSSSPTVDKRARLIALHRMFERARDNNQVALAANLLSQIAAESDGAETGILGGDGKDRSRQITRTIVDPVDEPE